MIQQIIFDLGNVLIYIHPEKTMSEFARRCELSENQVRGFYLSDLHLDFMAGQYHPNDFYQKMMEKFPCNLSMEDFIGVWNQVIGAPKTGMAQLVSDLKRKYTLSICSNTDTWHWGKVLQEVPFIHDFEHFFLSFHLKRNKPDPSVFQDILTTLEIRGENCLFIDDTQENIEMAARFGIQGIHASDPGIIRSELLSQGILS